MQPSHVMQLDTPKACLQALAARGRDPDLVGLSGVWELDLEGDAVWSVQLDDGRVVVREGPTGRGATRLRMGAADFVRLATGTGHENLITSTLRGAVKVDGDVRFAAQLQTLLPLREGEKGVS